MHPSVPDLEQLALDISRLDGERLCVVLDIIQSNEPTLTFDGELDLQALRAKTIAKLRKYLSKQMLGVTSLQANEASSSSYDEHRHAKQLIRLYKLSLKKCLSMRQSRREPDLRKRLLVKSCIERTPPAVKQSYRRRLQRRLEKLESRHQQLDGPAERRQLAKIQKKHAKASQPLDLCLANLDGVL